MAFVGILGAGFTWCGPWADTASVLLWENGGKPVAAIYELWGWNVEKGKKFSKCDQVS